MAQTLQPAPATDQPVACASSTSLVERAGAAEDKKGTPMAGSKRPAHCQHLQHRQRVRAVDPIMDLLALATRGDQPFVANGVPDQRVIRARSRTTTCSLRAMSTRSRTLRHDGKGRSH